MKIICIGRNYAAHIDELSRGTGGGTARPAAPVWFLKPDTALLRNNDPFYIPRFSQEVHYECELVVRIALRYICGSFPAPVFITSSIIHATILPHRAKICNFYYI